MNGSVEQGRAELSKALQKSKTDTSYGYLRDETLFYLGFVELNINPDKKQALALLNQLTEARQDNLLLSYLSIDIYIRTGQNEAALKVFSQIENRKGTFPFHYLDYLNGECLLHELELQKARKKYTLFLENFTGKNYLKDAWRKTAWIALLGGDTLAYFDILRQVPLVGDDIVDIDKQAEKEAENAFLPNIELLKTRLLFDGGYYLKADSVLTMLPTENLTSEQNLERYYRRARIMHELGNMEEAKTAYLLTIEKGSESPRYFAGNAALKLAGIYESAGELTKAEQYYRTCLKFDFTEYRTSIRSKAKAGLKRVSDKQDQ